MSLEHRIAKLEERIAELERRIANMLRRVSVSKTEAGTATVRVQDGSGFESGSVEVAQGRAGKNATWSPVDEGEQGLLFCPDGDTSQGVFMGGLPSDNSPAISTSQDEQRTNFGDGGYISYNRSSGAMNINLVTSLTANIAGVSISIAGGKITINGADVILPSNDVVAIMISLVKHIHPHSDSAGHTGFTSKPQ